VFYVPKYRILQSLSHISEEDCFLVSITERTMESNEQLFELPVLIGENEIVTLFLSKKDMEKATTGKIVMYLCIMIHFIK